MKSGNRFAESFGYNFFFFIAKIVAIIIAVFFFWYLKDINLLLYNIQDPFATSDLLRYYDHYNHVLNNPPDDKDLGYYYLAFFFKKIGFSFEFFIFIFLFLYYLIISIVFYKITFVKNWFIYFILIVLGSFLLVPLFTVAFRQGIATLILLFFLFRSDSLSLIFSLFIVILASTVHFSAIAFLLFFIFEKFIKIDRIKLIDRIFITTCLLYVAGFFEYTSNLFINFSLRFNLDVRALANENDYRIGFSIYKFIAIVIPALLYRLTNFLNKHFGLRIYLFYIFITLIGMFLSGLPYHDRILLYAFAISPILITCFIIFFLNNLLNMSIKKL